MNTTHLDASATASNRPTLGARRAVVVSRIDALTATALFLGTGRNVPTAAPMEGGGAGGTRAHVRAATRYAIGRARSVTARG